MIDFRNADLSDLEQVIDWAADEGWNPGLDDAETFFQSDPHGFFVAADEVGDLRAAISVVNHSADFAFLGLYIVPPRYRGQGLGLGLWRHAMTHAGDRTVGLDGVEAQQGNYVASGFSRAGGTTRFSGRVPPVHDRDIRLATAGDIPDLILAEAAASGVTKPAYLTAWLTPARTRTTLILAGPDGQGGFCTVRKCRDGAKIGPLVADSTSAAHRLIAHAATCFEGPITLDVPESSSGLSELCGQLGLEAGFRTARMYRGSFDTVAHPDFAVVSLELG